MSVLHRVSDECWLVDHQLFLATQCNGFITRSGLFAVHNPYFSTRQQDKYDGHENSTVESDTNSLIFSEAVDVQLSMNSQSNTTGSIHVSTNVLSKSNTTQSSLSTSSTEIHKCPDTEIKKTIETCANSPPNDSLKRKRKKRKRRLPLNSGEISFAKAHSAVRTFLIECYDSLSQSDTVSKLWVHGTRTSIPLWSECMNDSADVGVDEGEGIRVQSNEEITHGKDVLFDHRKNVDVVVQETVGCTTETDIEPYTDFVSMSELASLAKADPEEVVIVPPHAASKRNCDEGTCDVQDVNVCGTDVFTNIVKNASDVPLCMCTLGRKYIFPPRSSFFMGDVSALSRSTATRISRGRKFSLIVLDPPWENKSVKRSRNYKSMPHQKLRNIPIPRLISEDGVVAVWVTNKIAYQDYVRDVLFPSWGLYLVSTWYWLKITSKGSLVVDMESEHKKPYEVILIGRRHPKSNPHANTCNTCTPTLKSSPAPASIPMGTPTPLTPQTNAPLTMLPQKLTLCSIPSLSHSRKPPLGPIFDKYLEDSEGRLEIFARSLTPGWSCIGNEVLKFQDTYFFEKFIGR
eukprot:CFRG5859T1